MISKKLLRKTLIHGKSGADIIRSRIPDAEQVERGLYLAVLAVFSMQPQKYRIRHAADRQDIRTEVTSAPILPQSFDPADIRIALLDPADILRPLQSFSKICATSSSLPSYPR